MSNPLFNTISQIRKDFKGSALIREEQNHLGNCYVLMPEPPLTNFVIGGSAYQTRGGNKVQIGGRNFQISGHYMTVPEEQTGAADAYYTMILTDNYGLNNPYKIHMGIKTHVSEAEDFSCVDIVSQKTIVLNASDINNIKEYGCKATRCLIVQLYEDTRRQEQLVSRKYNKAEQMEALYLNWEARPYPKANLVLPILVMIQFCEFAKTIDRNKIKAEGLGLIDQKCEAFKAHLSRYFIPEHFTSMGVSRLYIYACRQELVRFDIGMVNQVGERAIQTDPKPYLPYHQVRLAAESADQKPTLDISVGATRYSV
jgi:hypothetical protein